MSFPMLKELIKESKVFDVLADEILEVNILAASKGLNAEGKQKVKDLFKELHSANPDLNKIHAEIEELKASLGAKETPSEEETEQKVLDSGASLVAGEIDVLDALLDLNAKLARSSKRSEFKGELVKLKDKIGQVDDSEILHQIEKISMEIADSDYSYSKPPRRN